MTDDVEARPPSRRSPTKRRCRRSKPPKMRGTLAIRRRSAWRIRRTRSGVIATNTWSVGPRSSHFDPQVAARARLLAAQVAVGFPRQPDRRAVPVRMPRRGRAVVSQLRKRTVEFAPNGLMARREASINDVPIDESERRYFGPARPPNTGRRSRFGDGRYGVQLNVVPPRQLSKESGCTRHDRCADRARQDRRGRRVRHR